MSKCRVAFEYLCRLYPEPGELAEKLACSRNTVKSLINSWREPRLQRLRDRIIELAQHEEQEMRVLEQAIDRRES